MNRRSAAVALLLFSSTTASAAVRFVNASATGANNGTTWANAFTDLQSAMASSSSGDEIWVARGIYKPTTGADRTIRFILNPDVSLRGGFVGTEISPAQRPADPNPLAADPLTDTVLSGDIGAPGFGDNSNRIIQCNAPGGGTLIERVVLTDAESLGVNDGALSVAVNALGIPTVRDTLIVGNRGGRGGGVNINSSNILFQNCGFFANSSTNDVGGAVYSIASPSLTFNGCTFQGNSATVGGGGAVNIEATTAFFNSCTFNANTANGEGGAVRVSNFFGSSSAQFTTCTFNNNTSSGTNTGGAVLIRNSAGTFTDCSLNQNTAAQGGAIGSQDGGSITATDCTFFDNTANFGGALFPTGATTTTITRCVFDSNQAGTGGVIEISFSGPLTIDDSDFINNQATSIQGGAISSLGGTITVRNSRFQANSSASIGGALYIGSGNPRFLNCRFLANTSVAPGAAVIVQGGIPLFAGCLFSGNAAGAFGAAFSATGNNAGGTLINCTIVNNTSASLGSAVRVVGPLTITNCIIRSNTASTQIDGSNFTASYSNVAQAIPGIGNINADPLFTNFAAGDFTLSAGSPSIDAANSAAVPVDLTTDLASNPRRSDDPATADTGAGPAPIVDMGAYEVTPPPTGCPGDANGDSTTNGADLSVLLAQFGQTVTPGSGADFNHDGFVNGADLSVLLSNFGNSCT